jgi:hypothetical protein
LLGINILDYPSKRGGKIKQGVFMRKTIVTALVTLLVMLAVVSCDSFITGEKPTADGLVTLSISTGGTASNSRSINLDIAKEERDYVEVIFRKAIPKVDPSDPDEPQLYDYYRTEGVYGSPLSIKVPTGTYKKEDAIVLAGKNLGATDKRLLGTGLVTVVTTTVGGSATDTPIGATDTFTIGSTTTSITFTAHALVADLTAPGTDTDPRAFAIIETSGTPAANMTKFVGKTGNAQSSSNIWYQVPQETSGIKATLTIGGFDDTGVLIARNGTTGLVTFVGPDAENHPITVTSVSFAADGDPVDTDLPSYGTIGDGVININFSTVTPGTGGFTAPADDHIGQYMVTFNIPVVGYATGISSSAITWHIRGGVIPGYDFENDKHDSIALLVVKEPILPGQNIIINGL